MIRNFKKALGLALLATFALSAVAASGASANFKAFDSTVTPTRLTGTSESDWVFNRGASFTCTHSAFEGTQVGLSVDAMELTVEYTTPSCTGPLNSVVHWDFISGQCSYHFTGTASKTAVLKLVCKNALMPEVTLTATNPDGSSLCTIHMLPQTFGGHLVFTNIKHNNIGSVTTESTITKITSVRTGHPACGPVNDAAGTYFGRVTITGYEDHEGAEGAQVAIEAT